MNTHVSLPVVVLFAAACSTADEAWLKRAEAYALTPKSDRVEPVKVLRTEGRVDHRTLCFAKTARAAVCRSRMAVPGRSRF